MSVRGGLRPPVTADLISLRLTLLPRPDVRSSVNSHSHSRVDLARFYDDALAIIGMPPASSAATDSQAKRHDTTSASVPRSSSQ